MQHFQHHILHSCHAKLIQILMDLIIEGPVNFAQRGEQFGQTVLIVQDAPSSLLIVHVQIVIAQIFRIRSILRSSSCLVNPKFVLY